MTCGLRCCPFCEKKRRLRLLARFSELFKEFKNPKLLTLTYRYHRDLSKEMKSTVHKNAREFFRRTGMSGIWVLEIKRKLDGYFYHIHAVIESYFIPQRRLSDIWFDITKDSFIVDIRKIRSKYALKYVVKYVVKPISNMSIYEYMFFFKKTRMITRFGRFYNLKVIGKRTFLICSKCNSTLYYSHQQEMIVNYNVLPSDRSYFTTRIKDFL